MNLKLIRKYEKEFLHMLHGGKVLMGKKYLNTNRTKWYPSVLNPFVEIADNIIIVLDDEYAPYRIALAEGKTIQFRQTKNDWWADANSNFNLHVDCYRIKPEEPKFKVGDWLIEIHSNSYAKVLEVFTQEIRVKLYDCNSIITTESTDFKLWQPQLGELVILKNKNDIISIIKYNGETNVYPFIGEITWLHKKD